MPTVGRLSAALLQQRKQFTITVGTIFEGSHVGLQKWFLILYFMGVSK